jgi:hypothetical protein
MKVARQDEKRIRTRLELANLEKIFQSREDIA